MEKVLNDELVFLILSIVAEIPKGKVATYGQIASLTALNQSLDRGCCSCCF